MVFQNPDNQLVATTVEEDVAFGPENLGVPSNEIRARVDEALKWVNMLDHKKRSLTNCPEDRNRELQLQESWLCILRF